MAGTLAEAVKQKRANETLLKREKEWEETKIELQAMLPCSSLALALMMGRQVVQRSHALQ